MDTFAYDHNLPCLNPNCRSHGRPHPNCRCYSGGGEDTGHLAKGGMVSHCSTGAPHLEDCEYFASGGMAESPAKALGHAAAHHGLSGMLKSVGHAKMADPDKHIQALDKAKRHMMEGNHKKADASISGHPMTGGIGKHLPAAMGELAPSIMDKEAHPAALKSSMDYLHSSHKGREALKSHVKGMFGDGPEAEPEEALRETLKGHLTEIEQSPEKLMDVAGNLGHYMPEHATQLASMLSTATEYLQNLKPQPTTGGPLQDPIPPNRVATAAYNRQVDIAEQPLLLTQHVKDGTLLPQDVQTVKTIYPGLYQSMIEKAGESIIDAKTKGQDIPYRKRLSLSMLMEQPLDPTQAPSMMRAIINSQAGQQAQQQQKNGKASELELKQINKSDAMAATDIQDRQIDKKISKM